VAPRLQTHPRSKQITPIIIFFFFKLFSRYKIEAKAKRGVLMTIATAKQIKHPYISCNPKISKGSPVILGTRVRVIDIAIEYEKLGHTPDEIVEAHPHLTLEAVHDALSYYYENRLPLDDKIRSEKEFIKKVSQKTPAFLKKTCA
jgi:uncharacterized protein (DUF433 family)